MNREETSEATLARITDFLCRSTAVLEKVSIQNLYAPATLLSHNVSVGDDCAAIPDGDGFLLFAAEGMLESFVAYDPWFAGYSAVMVNLSDVAAMGGRPLAVVDVMWTPSTVDSKPIWNGMAAASRAYGVPIVGGHTTITHSGSSFLAAAVLGKASRLITSFDAKPGDDLLIAIDLRGSYRGDKPFWNASVDAPSERLQGDLALLPEIAERGLCRAGKDISNGGIVGTLSMLLQCSKVGAELWMDQLPRPDDADIFRWLIAFPSFGYLLSVKPQFSGEVIRLFHQRGIACQKMGEIKDGDALVLKYGSAKTEFTSEGL